MGDTDLHRGYATAQDLFQRGRYQESLVILDRLVRQHGPSANLLYARALCLAELDRVYEALQVCNRVAHAYRDARAEALKRELRQPRVDSSSQGNAQSIRRANFPEHPDVAPASNPADDLPEFVASNQAVATKVELPPEVLESVMPAADQNGFKVIDFKQAPVLAEDPVEIVRTSLRRAEYWRLGTAVILAVGLALPLVTLGVFALRHW